MASEIQRVAGHPGLFAFSLCQLRFRGALPEEVCFAALWCGFLGLLLPQSSVRRETPPSTHRGAADEAHRGLLAGSRCRLGQVHCEVAGRQSPTQRSSSCWSRVCRRTEPTTRPDLADPPDPAVEALGPHQPIGRGCGAPSPEGSRSAENVRQAPCCGGLPGDHLYLAQRVGAHQMECAAS